MSVSRTTPGVLLALLVALMSGCRAPDSDRPQPDAADSRGHSASLDSAPAQQLLASARAWVDSIRADERPRLRAAGEGAARPRWDRLVLTARNGDREVFTDEAPGGELRRLHVYDGYIAALEQHLVQVIDIPEGGAFILVDARTGQRLEVDGPPLPSPDRSRFITTSLDLVAGHRPNRIRIYRVTAGGPVVEWETSPRDWGAAAPHWLDSSAIRLDRTVVDTTTSPFTFRASPMRIERDDGEWRIVP